MPKITAGLFHHFRPASVAALLGFVSVLWAATAAAQQASPRRKTVFDGQWSLTYRVTTQPGGGTRQGSNSTSYPVNISFLAAKKNFQVKEDGTFAWEEREDAAMHHDEYIDIRSSPPGWSRYTSDYQGLLRASGSGEERSRTLTLKLQWVSGSGLAKASYNQGRPSMTTVTVSADATTYTATDRISGGSVTGVPQVTQSSWTLAPESIEREDAGTDIEKERVTYRKTRPAAGDPGRGVPLFEEIEIIQVRYVKLVPRG
ncbi:MAG: hypothetical protein ACR2FY_05390 [Pirellulaceae bacterium]